MSSTRGTPRAITTGWPSRSPMLTRKVPSPRTSTATNGGPGWAGSVIMNDGEGSGSAPGAMPATT